MVDDPHREMWERYVRDPNDKDARERLYAGVLPMVYKLAYDVCRRSPAYDVDDLVNAAFVLIMKQAPRFDPTRAQKVSGWIWTIARYAMCNHVAENRSKMYRSTESKRFIRAVDLATHAAGRRLTAEDEMHALGLSEHNYRLLARVARKPITLYGDPAVAAAAIDGRSDRVENQLLREDLQSLVRARLTPEYAELIECLYFDGESTKELAAKRGCTEATILNLEKFALARLRPILEAFAWDIESLIWSID